MTTNDYRKTPESLSRLSDEQHRVTQQDGTEPAYRNCLLYTSDAADDIL